MEPWVIVVIALGTLGVLSLIPAAIKWHAERTIAWFNLRRLELDRPIDQYTRLLLDENGLTGVEVKVCGFWKSLFVGNIYAYRHHTVWLSSWTARRPTKTNLAVACRLVALAKDCEAGGHGAALVSANRFVELLPFLLVPLTIVGMVIDLTSRQSLGAAFFTLTGIGFALALASWIFAFVTYGANKRALADGLYLILASGLLTPEEEKKMKSLFASWRSLYFFRALLTTFEVLWLAFRLIAGLVTISSKRR